jgi:hypothetical protein
MVIPVDSAVFVHLVDVEFLLLDEIVVTDHNSSEWAHEAGVTGKKSEQTSGVVDDVPWSRDNAEDADDDCGTENVDILGIQSTDVVAEWVGT